MNSRTHIQQCHRSHKKTASSILCCTRGLGCNNPQHDSAVGQQPVFFSHCASNGKSTFTQAFHAFMLITTMNFNRYRTSCNFLLDAEFCSGQEAETEDLHGEPMLLDTGFFNVGLLDRLLNQDWIRRFNVISESI